MNICLQLLTWKFLTALSTSSGILSFGRSPSLFLPIWFEGSSPTSLSRVLLQVNTLVEDYNTLARIYQLTEQSLDILDLDTKETGAMHFMSVSSLSCRILWIYIYRLILNVSRNCFTKLQRLCHTLSNKCDDETCCAVFPAGSNNGGCV